MSKYVDDNEAFWLEFERSIPWIWEQSANDILRMLPTELKSKFEDLVHEALEEHLSTHE